MRRILGVLCASVVIGSCSPARDTHPDQANAVNQLTPEERAAGWQLLFDGRTMEHWRGYRQTALPKGWQVVEGAITRVDSAGDIVSTDEYRDFELSLEWKVAEGGNSGIFWRVSEDQKYPWGVAPRCRCWTTPDIPTGVPSSRRPERCTVCTHHAAEWYTPRANGTRPAFCVQGNRVEYWLNGVKLVEAEIGNKDWNARLARSKFATMPRYGRNPAGRIGLQDHGDWVAFRNIKIRVQEPSS